MSECIVLGDLSLETDAPRVYWKGRQVGLTPGQYRMVRELVRHADEPRTFRELYNSMRGNGFIAGDGEDGFQDNVRAVIKRARDRFRVVDPAFKGILNCCGIGYKWARQEPDGVRAPQSAALSGICSDMG